MDARDLINLQEAYLKSVEPQQLDEISPDLGLRASKAADQKRAQLARSGDKEGAAAKAAQAKRLYDKQAAKRLNREEAEIDLFDYMLDYLVSEGYADTNQAAIAIMANMSEEWRQSIVEEVLDEAEGSYGATPKAYSAASKTKMTAKRKPFLKKMLSRTNPANRTSAYDSPRKGMTSDDRERARAGSAHGVGTRQDHDYPSQGAGGVTKNPKKLRKQKAMGEFGEAYESNL